MNNFRIYVPDHSGVTGIPRLCTSKNPSVGKFDQPLNGTRNYLHIDEILDTKLQLGDNAGEDLTTAESWSDCSLLERQPSQEQNEQEDMNPSITRPTTLYMPKSYNRGGYSEEFLEPYTTECSTQIVQIFNRIEDNSPTDLSVFDRAMVANNTTSAPVAQTCVHIRPGLKRREVQNVFDQRADKSAGKYRLRWANSGMGGLKLGLGDHRDWVPQSPTGTESYGMSHCTPLSSPIGVTARLIQRDTVPEAALDFPSRRLARQRIHQTNLQRLKNIYAATEIPKAITTFTEQDDYVNRPAIPIVTVDHYPSDLPEYQSWEDPGSTNLGQKETHYSDYPPESQTMPITGRKPTTEDKMQTRKAEQERVQKKTFTNWLNTYLCNSDIPMKIIDLYEDMRDGIALIRILEVLSKQKLHTEVRPQMQKVHCLANIKTATEFLAEKNVRLVNINPSDIYDGRPAIVLGLIWSIILHFQIEEQEELLMKILGLPAGTRSRGSAKQILKKWVQDIFAGKYDVQVQDFGPSWRDGYAFSAMVHNIDSNLVQMDQLRNRSHRENLEHAFVQAETYLGIPRLLDPEDVDVDRPDEKSIMTYVAQFFKAYPDAGKRSTSSGSELKEKEISLVELISSIRKTEERIKMAMKEKKTGIAEQFTGYEKAVAEASGHGEHLQAFQEQLEEESLSGSTQGEKSSELEIAEEAYAGLQNTIDQWRWYLDSLLPGELGAVAEWIAQAEQWIGTSSKSWYQRTVAKKLVGLSGLPTESWRPGSADPPNSPPSLPTLERLTEEELRVFGEDNQKTNTVRENLRLILSNPSTIDKRVPQGMVDQLSVRLSSVADREPGCASVIRAAKSRRELLDLLYATKIRENEYTLNLQARRKTSVAGFERRLASWNAVADGSNTREDKDLVKEKLADYESCVQIEKIPEKLDQANSGVVKQYNKLVDLAEVDESILPANALKVVGSWVKDGELKWNSERASRVHELGELLKKRLGAWDTLIKNCDKIERWISEAERLVANGQEPPEERADLERWMDEAHEAAEVLGESADHHRLLMFERRLEQLNANHQQIKITETVKLRAAVQEERGKAERELNRHLQQVEAWIQSVDALFSPKSTTMPCLKVDCTEVNLNRIIAQLTELMKKEPQAQSHLHSATQAANNQALQPLEGTYRERLHTAQTRMVALSPSLSSKMADLRELLEKTHHIEANLEKIKDKVTRQETMNVNCSSDQSETEEVSPKILNDLAESREQTMAVMKEVEELERILHSDRNWELTNVFGLGVSHMKTRIREEQNRITEAENSFKREMNYLQELEDALCNAERTLEENEENLRRMAETAGKASKVELQKLLRTVEALRNKYEESKALRSRVGVLGSPKLSGPGSALRTQFDPATQAGLARRMDQLSNHYDRYGEQLEELQADVLAALDRIKSDEEEVTRSSQWITKQENRLGTLSAGPSALPLSPSGDSSSERGGIHERLEALAQWVNECRNFSNNLENDVVDYRAISALDQTDSSGDNFILVKRYHKLQANSKRLVNEGESQMKSLQTFSVNLEDAKNWLASARRTLTSINQKDDGVHDPDSFRSKLQMRQKQLEELRTNLSTGGDHVEGCKKEIQRLIEAGARQNTTAVVMVARKELSDFQNELEKLQREVEGGIKNTESKIARHTKLLSELNSEKEWLRDIEKQMPGSLASGLVEECTSNDLTLKTNSEIKKLTHLMNSLQTHGNQAYQHLRTSADQIGDQYTLAEVEDWYHQLQDLRERATHSTSKTTEIGKLLQEFQRQIEDLQNYIRDLESQRALAINVDVASKETNADRSEAAQTALKNSAEQIKSIMAKQPEAQLKLQNLKNLAQRITPKPTEAEEMEKAMQLFFTKLQQDYNLLVKDVSSVELLQSAIKEMNKLLDDISKQLESLDSCYPDLEMNDADGRGVVTVLRFYKNQHQTLKKLAAEFEPESGLSLARVQKLGEEIEEQLEQLDRAHPNATAPLRTVYRSQHDRISGLRSQLSDSLSARDKLISSLEAAIACYKAAKEHMTSIEKAYKELEKARSSSSAGVMIKSINELLYRVKSDGSATRNSLFEAVHAAVVNINNLTQKRQPGQSERIVSLISDLPRSFEEQIDSMQATLETLLKRYKMKAKSEQSLSFEVNDTIKELRAIIAQISKVEKRLESIVDLNELSKENDSLKDLIKDLGDQERRVANVHDEIRKSHLDNTEMATNVKQMDNLLSEAKAAVSSCTQLLEKRQSDANRFKQAIEHCADVIRQMEVHVDQILRGDVADSDRSPVRKSPYGRQASEVDSLIEEIRIAKEELSGKLCTNRTQFNTSDLVNAVDSLLQASNRLPRASIQSEWTQFMNKLERLLDKLTEEKNRQNQVAESFSSWDTEMRKVDQNIRDISRDIQNKSSMAVPEIELQQDLTFTTRYKILQEIEKIDSERFSTIDHDLKCLRQQMIDLHANSIDSDSKRLPDQGTMNDRLERAEENYSSLGKSIKGLLERYRGLVQEQDQSMKVLSDALRWAEQYEADVHELESQLPSATGKQKKPPTDSWLSSEMTKVQQLEKRRVEGERMIRELIGCYSKTQKGVNHAGTRELNRKLQDLDGVRLKRIEEELVRIRREKEHYEALIAELNQSVTQFEMRLDSLKRNDLRSVSPYPDVTVGKSRKHEEQRWTQLLNDMDKFKAGPLKEFQKREAQLLSVSDGSLFDDAREHLDQIYNEVSEHVEANTHLTAALGKFSQQLEEYEESVNKLGLKYSKLKENLQLPLGEASASLQQTPSEFCESIARTTENAQKRLATFQKDCVTQLADSWQQLVLQASAVSESIDANESHQNLRLLQEDVARIQAEAPEIIKEARELKSLWADHEAMFERNNKDIESLNKTGDFLTSATLMPTYFAPLMEEFTHQPTAEELTKETAENFKKITNLHSKYQQEINLVSKAQNELIDGLPIQENLSSQLDELMYHFYGLTTTSNEQDPADKMKLKSTVGLTRPNADQVVGRFKQHYQSSIQRLTQNANATQTKMTHFTHLSKGIRDLDRWQAEFYGLLKNWNPRVKPQGFGATVGSVTNSSQLKFCLDTGQAHAQSIREWGQQLQEVDQAKDTAEFVHSQLQRVSQIVQNANNQFRLLQAEADAQQEASKVASEELLTIRDWLDKWKDRFTGLRATSTATLSDSIVPEILRKKDTEIARLLDQGEDLANELKTRRILFEQQSGSWVNLAAVQPVHLNSLDQAFKNHGDALAEFISKLTQVKVQMAYVSTCLQRARQWIRETTEQLSKACEGRGPTRIPPNPLSGDISKTGRMLPHIPNSSQQIARTISPARPSISPTRIAPSRSATPTLANFVRNYGDRLDWLDKLLEEAGQTGSQILQDITSATDKLDADLSALRVDPSEIGIEVERLHEDLEQLLSAASRSRNDLEEILSLAVEFERSLLTWRKWYNGTVEDFKCLVRRSVVGFQSRTDSDQALDNEYTSMDIVRPVVELIQQHQVLQNDVANWKTEIIRMDTLSDDLYGRSKDSGMKQRYSQVVTQYESLWENCKNVLPKIQTLFMEERNFEQNLEELKLWVKRKSAEFPSSVDSTANQQELESRNKQIQEINSEIEAQQPKLLELSDKADRVCRAASNAALGLNNVLLLSSAHSSTEGRESPGTKGDVRSEKPFVRLDQQETRKETAGEHAKKQLSIMREMWRAMNQQVSQLVDRSNHTINQHTKFADLHDRLLSWLEACEHRVEQLDNGQAEIIRGRSSPLKGQSSKISDTAWNEYLDEYKSLLRETENKVPEYEQLEGDDVRCLSAQFVKMSKDTRDRFLRLRVHIQQRTNWLLNVQKNIEQHRQVAGEADRWMTNMNFKLMNPAYNQFSETSSPTAPVNNEPEERTGSSAGIRATVMTQQNAMIREIEVDGMRLVQKAHELAHAIVHSALSDINSQGQLSGACASTMCDLRESPFSQDALNTLLCAVRANNKPLGNIALQVLQRTRELEINHANLHSSAMALKNQISEQMARWKVYVEILQSAATFLISDLPNWWAQVYSPDSVQLNIVPTTTYEDLSVPYLNGQLEHQTITVGQEPLIVVADSLEEVKRQQASTTVMHSRLNTVKRDVTAAAYKVGMTPIGGPPTHSGSMMERRNGMPIAESEQISVGQLAMRVQSGIERENKKLENRIDKLRELRGQWERYTNERDLLRRWMNDRQTASNHLVELRSRSSDPNDEERRALEDFVATLREKQVQVNSLVKQHDELVRHNLNISDPVLEQLRSEYNLLLSRTEARLRKIELQKRTNEVEKLDQVLIPPEKLDALLHQSAKTVQHTRALNQLTKSVRKINEELISNQGEDRQSRLATQETLLRPISTESIRRNYPPYASSLWPSFNPPRFRENNIAAAPPRTLSDYRVNRPDPTNGSVRSRRWSGYQPTSKEETRARYTRNSGTRRPNSAALYSSHRPTEQNTWLKNLHVPSKEYVHKPEKENTAGKWEYSNNLLTTKPPAPSTMSSYPSTRHILQKSSEPRNTRVASSMIPTKRVRGFVDDSPLLHSGYPSRLTELTAPWRP
ncbi:unnamed protein product [Calicophoron daubneyi]|uniref:Calponin-homology (CH) domain-containing protein n=1 Tax=Calicophoron daubneyi TaxID=300641 RepID=A0AAV2T950_CALDB